MRTRGRGGLKEELRELRREAFGETPEGIGGFVSGTDSGDGDGSDGIGRSIGGGMSADCSSRPVISVNSENVEYDSNGSAAASDSVDEPRITAAVEGARDVNEDEDEDEGEDEDEDAFDAAKELEDESAHARRIPLRHPDMKYPAPSSIAINQPPQDHDLSSPHPSSQALRREIALSRTRSTSATVGSRRTTGGPGRVPPGEGSVWEDGTDTERTAAQRNAVSAPGSNRRPVLPLGGSASSPILRQRPPAPDDAFGPPLMDTRDTVDDAAPSPRLLAWQRRDEARLQKIRVASVQRRAKEEVQRKVEAEAQAAREIEMEAEAARQLAKKSLDWERMRAKRRVILEAQAAERTKELARRCAEEKEREAEAEARREQLDREEAARRIRLRKSFEVRRSKEVERKKEEDADRTQREADEAAETQRRAVVRAEESRRMKLKLQRVLKQRREDDEAKQMQEDLERQRLTELRKDRAAELRKEALARVQEAQRAKRLELARKEMEEIARQQRNATAAEQASRRSKKRVQNQMHRIAEAGRANGMPGKSRGGRSYGARGDGARASSKLERRAGRGAGRMGGNARGCSAVEDSSSVLTRDARESLSPSSPAAAAAAQNTGLVMSSMGAFGAENDDDGLGDDVPLADLIERARKAIGGGSTFKGNNSGSHVRATGAMEGTGNDDAWSDHCGSSDEESGADFFGQLLGAVGGAGEEGDGDEDTAIHGGDVEGDDWEGGGGGDTDSANDSSDAVEEEADALCAGAAVQVVPVALERNVVRGVDDGSRVFGMPPMPSGGSIGSAQLSLDESRLPPRPSLASFASPVVWSRPARKQLPNAAPNAHGKRRAGGGGGGAHLSGKPSPHKGGVHAGRTGRSRDSQRDVIGDSSDDTDSGDSGYSSGDGVTGEVEGGSPSPIRRSSDSSIGGRESTEDRESTPRTSFLVGAANERPAGQAGAGVAMAGSVNVTYEGGSPRRSPHSAPLKVPPKEAGGATSSSDEDAYSEDDWDDDEVDE